MAKICSTTCHPTAEWVYLELKPEIPDLSLGTVYRNIGIFREEGTIASIGTVAGQERFDGNIAPHGHFVCRTCQSVIDFDDPVERIEAATHLADMGHQADRVELTVYGTCHSCLEPN